MTTDVEALLKRFQATPDVVFKPEEVEQLAGAASADLQAAKVAALHYFRSKEFARCLPLTELIFEREKSHENAVNRVVALREAGLSEPAVGFLRANSHVFEAPTYHDLSCSCLARLGRIAEAAEHGNESLKIKDAACKPATELPPLIIRAFDINEPRRNVIAFSVYGANSRYLTGAVNNACVARYLYPGWTARFYTDASAPEPVRDTLKRNGAQVVMMTELPAAQYGLFWRFLVEDDEGVDFFLVRDADSVLNIKERSAVAGWLRSGKAFHVMRDNPQHTDLMLAGMWGAHRGNIGRMKERILAYVAKLPKRANYLHKDQHFLRDEIWPIARSSVHIHDRYFDFCSPARYDEDYALPSGRHIGQDDWIFYRPDADQG
jgi:hypothetical protein